MKIIPVFQQRVDSMQKITVKKPVLVPNENEREGYVPNVVYR
jgi:hypothetical protein